MLVSLISHVIYALTGTRSEIVYRLVPELAAAATAGVAAIVLSMRFGVLAGASAGLYIATNPMFVENSRDLRGYSLATLCSLLATILLFGPRTRWRMVLYGTLLGLAMAAHLYAGLVLLAHVLWVLTRRSWPELRQMVQPWALAGLIAVAANGYILWVDATQHGFLPKLFDPTFPADLVFYLLGARSLLAIGLWLSTAALGLFALRRDKLTWASVALVVVVAGLLWLVVQPFYLYPRFFIVLIPACAYLIAAAVNRWKVLAPVVILGAVAAAISQVPGYTADPLALRAAASTVSQAGAAGRRVCLIHSDEQVLGAYQASGFTVVTAAGQLKDCDLVVVVSWGVELPLRDEAARDFPRATQLPALYPTVVLER